MRQIIPLLLLAVAPHFGAFAANPEPLLPIFFTPNAGQTDPEMRYTAQIDDLRAGFARDFAIFQSHGTGIRVRFPGASSSVRVEGIDPLSARANFLIGNDPAFWHTGIATFQGIVYRSLYPGIDMIYSEKDRQFKSEFRIAPGADPGRIRLDYADVDSARIGADGDLLIRSGALELRDHAPIAYQISPEGARRPVTAGYKILPGGRTVAFDLEEYDAALPLVIDPVISYSTYMGGSGQSAITAITVDASGNLYAAGWTEAVDFPVSNAIQAVDRGGVDAFMFKLNAAGSQLLYATYIGGRNDDRAAAIAVDSGGQVYLAGSTASSDFPLVSSLRPTLGGTRDAFVLKLNAIGNLLVYSTYLGGTGYDVATALALDSSGNAYVAGDTQSVNFPVSGPVQSALGGKTDVFITKLTPAGAILFSTYLGGANDEHAGGIALDSSHNIYVAGGTSSLNFPVAAPFQATNGGGQDAFVTKLSTSPQILYSSYLGGNGGQAGSPEQANAIAVDATGAAYVAGVTNSTNFPVTNGAFQRSPEGVQDAFITKVSAIGALVYSTYLGGQSFDWASGIAVDAGGNAWVTGYTSSAGFPDVASVQFAFNGFYDAFISELAPSGSGLTFSTFYGGAGADQANAIALDPSGNIYVGGQTSSLNLPLQGAIQSSNVGGSTGWVAKLGVPGGGAEHPGADSVSPSSGSGNAVTFTATYSHPAGAARLVDVALLLNTTASTHFACYVNYSPATNLFTLSNDEPATGGISVPPGSGTAQNNQCTLIGSGSSAVLSGVNLTLTVSLTFRAGFAGAKTVYLDAADVGNDTGFLAKGSWTVTVAAPAPSADSVSPNSSSGFTQVFTFVYSDTEDAANLSAVAVLFNTTVAVTNACYVVYDLRAGTVALLTDDALGSGSKPVNSTLVLQNSQCQVGVTTSTAAGLSQVFTIAITFKAAFNGLKNIYMSAAEQAVNTGWIQRGTYLVAAGGIPTADSVVPLGGSGATQRFSFTVSDAGGSGFIVAVAMLFAATFDTNNACSMVYDRTRNTISLAFDNPANGAATLVPGTPTIISNHQCSVIGANSTVVAGTTQLIVTVDIAFNAAFFGLKNTYLYAAEAFSNSGWVTVGSWTVAGGAPTADSVSPASGSGLSPNFVFTVSDSATNLNIIGINMLLTTGSPANLTNACYLWYNRTASTIGLYANDGVTLNTKGIGSSTTLQNSQCAVGFTTMTASGNSVIFTINLVFKSPAFQGAKTVYLQALEPNASSGWVARGTWTVP